MHLRHAKNNIPIELFRSFVAVAEYGSFTRAAEELQLTQPAISAQIKRLQRLMGGDLFVKKALGVGLSELGRRVERYARRILALNDQVLAIAGRLPTLETVRLGIQSVFAPNVLSKVFKTCPVLPAGQCRIICGSAPFLADKLAAGYVDLAVMIAQTESRRNVFADWNERLAWISAPNFSLAADTPIPFVGREEGALDRKVLEVLDDRGVAYRIVFSAGDLTSLFAAVEAGIGVMAVPERMLPHALVVARDRSLPKLPELRAAVFFKEGFDLKRNRSLVEAFLAAVVPPNVVPNRVARHG